MCVLYLLHSEDQSDWEHFWKWGYCLSSRLWRAIWGSRLGFRGRLTLSLVRVSLFGVRHLFLRQRLGGGVRECIASMSVLTKIEAQVCVSVCAHTWQHVQLELLFSFSWRCGAMPSAPLASCLSSSKTCCEQLTNCHEMMPSTPVTDVSAGWWLMKIS